MLRVHDWEEHQTYRTDRGAPPWIKVHRSLMRKLKWISLSDAERGQLLSIWMLAADNNGQVPACAQTIAKLCYLDTPPDLDKLTRLKFLDAEVAPRRRQSAAKPPQHDAPDADADANADANADAKADAEAVPSNSDELIELIVTTHPKPQKDTLTRQYIVQEAIKLEQGGKSPLEALEFLLSRTETYRLAMARLPAERKRYIVPSHNFFRDGEYKTDPAIWNEMVNEDSNGTHRKPDRLAQTLRNLDEA